MGFSLKIFLFSLQLSIAIAQDIRITEVMSDSLNGGDWFEITNSGNIELNLEGYGWRDQNDLREIIAFPSLVLPENESLVVLIGHDEHTFTSWWALETEIRLHSFPTDHVPSPPRLSGDGDEVNLYAPDGELIDTFETGFRHGGISFSRLTDGRSFSRLTDGTTVPHEGARRGINGYQENKVRAFLSNRDIASPGVVAPPADFAPRFEKTIINHAWPAGENFSKSSFRLVAVDPNPDDTLSIRFDDLGEWLDLPAWLSLEMVDKDSARLVGTPPPSAVGLHEIPLIVADGTGLSSDLIKRTTFHLEIIPPSSPIILNEYNGVAPEQFLGGGEENDDDGEFDLKLGRIPGNGGLWLKFVVVGSGSGLEPVDLRNLWFTAESDRRTLGFVTNENPALAVIPSGTILTFTLDNGTSPTILNDGTRAQSDGYFWTNISLHDRSLIRSLSGVDYPNSPHAWEQNLRVKIRNVYGGEVVMGPAGEGSAQRDSDDDGRLDTTVRLGRDEVFKLEEDPRPDTSPVFANYDDGKTSTFGAPNVWNNRQTRQNFNSYIPTNLPPVITGNPGRYCVDQSYQADFEISDPEDQKMAIELVDSPGFISIEQRSPGKYRVFLNRQLEAADIGDYTITLTANDEGAFPNTGYYSYQLTVTNREPTVIVNEINLVSRNEYLNGGEAISDSDGPPPAFDTALGRISGNGGDWFELVVVGDGGPSLVDLRGWEIEIGRLDPGGNFERTSWIALNSHPHLAAVSSGTILLFYESRYQHEEDPRFVPFDPLSGFKTGSQTMHFPISLERGSSRYLQKTRSKDRVIPMDLDANNTLIQILDSNGDIVFGPCGEGIIPGIKVGNDKVFELEAHPSPHITILSSRAGAGSLGFDDSDSQSTFGEPNQFLTPDGNLITQDFSQFHAATTTYEAWAEKFGLAPDSQTENFDSDGASNLEEYIGGTSPIDAADQPAQINFKSELNFKMISFDIRVNDLSSQVQTELSLDLQSWTTEGLRMRDEISPKGLGFRRRTVWQWYSQAPWGNFNAPKVYFRNRLVQPD